MVIHCDEYGRERTETILFIHGAGVAGWVWNKQLAVFSATHHCLVVDLPDHGLSLAEPFTTVEAGADSLLDLVARLGHGGKAVLVGHSLGAKLAAFMLARRPELVSRALIASALFRPSWLLSAMTSEKLFAWSLNLYRKYPALKRWQVKAFGLADPVMEAALMASYDSLTAGALLRPTLAYANRMSLPEGLVAASDKPVMLLAGSREPAAMKRSLADLATALPQAESHILPGCDHVYPVKAAALFNDLLAGWLSR